MAETGTVALVKGIDETAAEIFAQAGFDVEQFPASVSEGELVDLINDTEAVAVGVRAAPNITRAVIEACPSPRAYARYGVGLDSIDVEAATEAHRPVFNGGASTAPTVGQYVIAATFALHERLPVTLAEMGTGVWNKQSKRRQEIIPGETTMGVLGYGRIGQAVGNRALANGMNVVYFDPFREPSEAEVRTVLIDEEEVEVRAEQLSNMDAVLQTADVVSVNVPGIAANRHLISDAQLAAMPPGSMLINTSRGMVVDTAAVARAIRSGHLAGAAVDVFENEPKANGQPLDDPLAQVVSEGYNLQLTPHVAGSTEQGQRRVADVVSNLVVSCVVDGRLEDAVNARWAGAA